MLTATSTATLTRPTSSPAARPQPARPLAATRPARVATRIAEPAGLGAWRAAVSDADVQAPPTPAQMRRILAGVRTGTPLPVLSRLVRMSQTRVLDAVVGVGSRISQANKSGPKVSRCMSARQGAARELPGPGAHRVENLLVVVLADGWDKSAPHGRDISRAYAAVVLSDAAGDERPVQRWLDTLASEQEVTYAHYAHLFAVANGRLRSFEGLSDNRDVQQAYLRAFDDVADAVASASAAVTALCAPQASPEAVLTALRACYWMLPECRSLAGLARAAQAQAPGAAARLRVALANLRNAVERRPATFFPRNLSDLSQRQYRAILAERGHHPTDMADAARAETDFADLGAALAAVRERLLSEPDAPVSEELAQAMGASWRGLDA